MNAAELRQGRQSSEIYDNWAALSKASLTAPMIREMQTAFMSGGEQKSASSKTAARAFESCRPCPQTEIKFEVWRFHSGGAQGRLTASGNHGA
jgi:hypothetical protein